MRLQSMWAGQKRAGESQKSGEQIKQKTIELELSAEQITELEWSEEQTELGPEHMQSALYTVCSLLFGVHSLLFTSRDIKVWKYMMSETDIKALTEIDLSS